MTNLKQTLDKDRLDENWKGYTLDELRIKRAVAAARLQLQKERLLQRLQLLREGSFNRFASTAQRVGSYFPLLSSAILGVSVAVKGWSMIRRVKGLFSKKK